MAAETEFFHRQPLHSFLQFVTVREAGQRFEIVGKSTLEIYNKWAFVSVVFERLNRSNIQPFKKPHNEVRINEDLLRFVFVKNPPIHRTALKTTVAYPDTLNVQFPTVKKLAYRVSYIDPEKDPSTEELILFEKIRALNKEHLPKLEDERLLDFEKSLVSSKG